MFMQCELGMMLRRTGRMVVHQCGTQHRAAFVQMMPSCVHVAVRLSLGQ